VTTRRQFIQFGAALSAAAVAPAHAANPGVGDFDRAIVINGLGGLDDAGADFAPSLRMSAAGVAAFKASGLTAVLLTVGEVGNAPTVWDDTVKTVAFINRLIDANPDCLMRGLSVRDIRGAKATGRTAVIYGCQDTSMVGADLDRLTTLKGLGVRVVQVTYNLRNLSGDGALERANGGLSKLGRETIARIEAERMLVDFSHGGARLIAEGLAATTRPPIISHTGCRNLNDNPRNVWDSEMKACADRGGVVGIYWMPFLRADSKPTSADLVRHMTHARNICGEDHVGIGTDGGLGKTEINDASRAGQKAFYDRRAAQGIAAPGEGPDVFNIIPDWDDNLRFRHLAQGLSRAGWSTTQIEKALGGNLLRVYGETFG
jgi:membrane dipeptidase